VSVPGALTVVIPPPWRASCREGPRLHQGDPAVAVGAPLRDERYDTVRLGAGWEPQRHVQLGGSFDYGRRDSNVDDRDYGYFAVTLNLRWTY
jgi:hypothetical protein